MLRCDALLHDTMLLVYTYSYILHALHPRLCIASILKQQDQIEPAHDPTTHQTFACKCIRSKPENADTCSAVRRARSEKQTGKLTISYNSPINAYGHEVDATATSNARLLFSQGSALWELNPSMLATGFLFVLACCNRGTPCIDRGSFISAGSSFAGTLPATVLTSPGDRV